MTEEEKRLVNIAQHSQNDTEAFNAMSELRNRFDESYGWCLDCGYLVVKDSECCMNRDEDDNEETKD